FDGTISSLRSGWESVMEPLMCEMIPGDRDEVQRLVKNYIDESTGIQTILQMRFLHDEVKRRKGNALDPWEYKREYNKRLMEQVQKRRDAVESGKEDRKKYIVNGAEEFLSALKKRGVKLFAASGTDDKDVKAEAKILGLCGYFDEIAGAPDGSDACAKENILRRLVTPGRNLLVVGDGKVEIALGREAGALTLGIASWDEAGCTKTEENPVKVRRLRTAGAHAAAADFSNGEELLSWI
ncbi:MAG: HAD hydrolase-like protein, partial [Clostridia bacterium]|nr:HAD hydrolase-like protein [Clostridia bacterium]